MKTVSPIELLVPGRIDLIAKYTYIENYVKHYDVKWFNNLYKAHVEAFSGGNYTEPTNPAKNSIIEYEACFNRLIDDIGNMGLDSSISVVPISNDGQIVDGAHRTAVALYYNLRVPIHFIDKPPLYVYDYHFFRKQLLDEKYLQYMAYRYITIKPLTTRVLVFYPAAMSDKDKVEEADQKLRGMLSEGGIVYHRDIKLNYNGLVNFMIQAYGGQDWIGTQEENYKGVSGKADPCYDKCETLRVYVIDFCNANPDEQLIKIKTTLRNVFSLGNHSVHSSDNIDETLLLGQLLLNDNSIHMLNNGDLRYDCHLNELIKKFRSELSNNNIISDDYLVDSSAVMGLYGLRKTRDFGYITCNDGMDDIFLDEIDNHESYICFYNKTKEELVYNPESYFFVWSIKVITLETLLEFKKNRQCVKMPDIDKDRNDICIIEARLKSTESLIDKIILSHIGFKRYCRNIRTKIRDWLQGNNIYFFTKLWHFIKGKGFE